MSSGSTGSLSPPPNGVNGVWSGRTWSGNDGKYESFSGGIRTRWNSYSTRHCAMQISEYRIGMLCPEGHVVYYGSPHQWWNNSTEVPFSNAEVNSILSRLLDKVKGHSFNAAVNIAQSNQVASMVVSNLGSLGRSVMALRHGDFATAARQLGVSPRPTRLKPSDVSGRWLELQYGWLPTLSDTFEAMKAFEAIRQGPAKTRFSTRKTKTSFRLDGGSLSSYRARLELESSHGYTYEMYEEPGFARQLGLTDPLSVAWELIPYSFVVDWFVPIGTYLSNQNQIPSLSGRWMVTKSQVMKGVSFEAVGALLPFCDTHTTKRYVSVATWPRMQYYQNVTTRNALGSPPTVPFPSVSLAGAVHGRRVWNAISLAQQRFSGNPSGSAFVTSGGLSVVRPGGRRRWA